MPRSSASPLTGGIAAVFDFLPALARKRLHGRVGLRGSIHVFASGEGIYTLVHQHRIACGAELAEHRIAQLRSVSGGYQLFWKKGNGRWTAYCGGGADCFVGSIDACLAEIARDPFGCYWA